MITARDPYFTIDDRAYALEHVGRQAIFYGIGHKLFILDPVFQQTIVGIMHPKGSFRIRCKGDDVFIEFIGTTVNGD